MQYLGVFITWVTSSIFARIVAGLGIAIITYGWVMYLFDQVMEQIQGLWAQIPADLLAYLTIGGFTDGAAIILSALATRGVIAFAPALGFGR